MGCLLSFTELKEGEKEAGNIYYDLIKISAKVRNIGRGVAHARARAKKSCF